MIKMKLGKTPDIGKIIEIKNVKWLNENGVGSGTKFAVVKTYPHPTDLLFDAVEIREVDKKIKIVGGSKTFTFSTGSEVHESAEIINGTRVNNSKG